MYLNTRSFLFAGVALAGLFAGLGGFLFFANVPDPGASREEVYASIPPQKQLQQMDINRIIAERQALAPRPGNAARAQVAAAIESGPMLPSLSKAEERFAMAESDDDALARERDDGRAEAPMAGGIMAPTAPSPEPPAKSKEDAPVDALRAAADRNDAAAQFSLAARLETGNGVAVDKVEALKFYILAAAQGVTAPASEAESATDRRDETPVARLSAELSPDQVRDAENRAAAFQAQ